MRRRTWLLTGVGVLLVVAGIGGSVLWGDADSPATSAQSAAPNTEPVEKGTLAAALSATGTLTYRAQADGSPYPVINQADGIYTQLPAVGDRVGCGDPLYRVDDAPVLLLCGTVPIYRELHTGMAGPDVRQLNRNLHQLGYDTAAAVDPDDATFTAQTAQALGKLQHDKGLSDTGTLAVRDAVFLPGAVRIAKATSQLGAAAQPGGQVAQATSDTLSVRVDLDPSQQGQVQKGDRAQITLPGNTSVTGRVDGFGRVAQGSPGQDGNAADPTIPTYISLDDPTKARGLDQAPVQVDIATAGVDDALSVPVTALVGRSGGGYAVEVVRENGRRDLVAVELGLFDSAGGRVQVDGDLREGELVVVPSL